jgi:glutaredoxin
MGQFTLLAMGTVSYFSLNILLFEGGTMAQRLDLYYYPECPYCQKVLRAMRSLGIEDKITLKNIHQDRKADETLVAVGGKHQVPCLFIDGDPMYESDDIVAWMKRELA